MSLPAPDTPPASPYADRLPHNEHLRRLITRAKASDVRAFEQLYVATCRWLLVRVRRLVGESLAEDVLADAYLQIWRTLPSFDGARGEPMAWMVTIARTRALDRLRAERMVHGGLPGAAEAVETEMGHSHGPEQILELSQLRESVHDSLAGLSAKERMVLALAYFGDFSQREISDHTGLPLGSVKSLMTRSQQKLRARLSPARPPETPALPSGLASAVSPQLSELSPS
jgi:RNA polymerase sigma-70 factor (ECF subfamily)